MDNKRDTTLIKRSIFETIISWTFALAVFAVGLINLLWGNDGFFGIFLMLLSFVYMPPVDDFIRNRLGFSTPLIAKIVLAIFIIWASLGVGELFHKIDLMMMDING
ncbi:MAG TPA: hypothetical protein VM935_15975, partial [Chitinophagaceae bacterium]|nr:hypothetical protein [Chitinophagaceae bacterium]